MASSHDYLYRGNPNEFMARVSRIPNLEADEELTLIKRWQSEQSQNALNTLLAAHQKLLVKMIYQKRMAGHFGDALQAGNVGLMKAVERFSEEAGVRFSTYALWWARAEMEMIYEGSIVNVGTTAARKVVKRHLPKALREIRHDDLPPTYQNLEEAAKLLNVPLKDVLDIYPLMGGDASLDEPLRGSANEESTSSRMDFLADQRPSPEDITEEMQEVESARAKLQEALNILEERPRYIFHARRLADPPVTLEDLANEFNVSRERIRQIEVKAFEEVAHYVLHGEAKPKSNHHLAARRRYAGAEPETLEI